MRRGRSATLAAVYATLAMVLAMVVGRFTVGTPLIPELIAQQIFALVPPVLFTPLIRTFGFWAKWLAFALAIVGYIAGGLALGWGYGRWSRAPSIAMGCLFGGAIWLVVMTIVLPLLGAGFFGTRLRAGIWVGAGGLLVLHLLYGALLGWLAGPTPSEGRAQQPGQAASSGLERRALLRGLVGLPMVGFATAAAQLCLAVAARLASASALLFEAIKGLAPEVTPNAKFYTISINLFDPTVNPRTWRLKIHGLVENPVSLSLDDLKAMPAHEAYITFICISNEIGGRLIGNALWTGVPLKDLLALARLKEGARKVVFRADDGYSTGVPLERCLRPQTFLAYAMNGEALPQEHGFPLRAVIPGYYGMKQPKWLTEIEVVGDDYLGYWEERGWADEAVVKTMSRIDVPPHRGQISRTGQVIAGVAFAGDRGIKGVEYSIDGGQTWQEAQVKPPLSPYSWVLWAGNLELPHEGEYLLAVRATDGQGHEQDARVAEPLPDGASGYHKLRIKTKHA
jgi:DMSO/TMAO reductase YedYZ molybdopterin-dependent catalytic subunit